MNKNLKFLAIAAVAVALVFAGYGLFTGKFTGSDVFEAGKAQVAGGDAIKVLCTKYVADKNVVIAPSENVTAVSNSVPNTPVVSEGETKGSTTTTVTPGPVPLGMPLPDGAATEPYP